MGRRGPELHDEPEVYRRYVEHRMRPETPNDAIERPVFLFLVGSKAGRHDTAASGCREPLDT